MKKSIAYINPDCYIHVDLTVLANLAQEFDILWIPILSEGFSEYSEDYLRGYAREAGIKICIMRNTFRMRSPRNLPWYLSLVRQINQGNVDLVFCAHNNPYWFLASFLLKAPLVYGIHDFNQHSNFNQGRLLHAATQLGIRRCNYFIFYSKQQLHRFQDSFPRKKAVNVGMVALDYGESTQVPPPIQDGIKLLFFGRIDSYKGLDLLISEIETLTTDGISNLTLTIRGRGSFWKKCESLIVHRDRFDIQIRFIGSEEIPDLFSTHHFLVLPYRDTTQSGPMMIAIRYGLPVIAPEHPAFLEYCTKTNAILYEPQNLSNALCTCSHLSQSEYDSIVSEWIRVRSACTPAIVSSRYTAFFNKILL